MESKESAPTVDMRQPLLEIVIESWRLAKLFQRVISKLDGAESNRYVNQIRYFQKRVDETLSLLDLRLVSLEGYPYDLGMAATPLNIADFGPDDTLVVDQMVEPVLMGPEGVVKSGTILLKRVD